MAIAQEVIQPEQIPGSDTPTESRAVFEEVLVFARELGMSDIAQYELAHSLEDRLSADGRAILQACRVELWGEGAVLIAEAVELVEDAEPAPAEHLSDFIDDDRLTPETTVHIQPRAAPTSEVSTLLPKQIFKASQPKTSCPAVPEKVVEVNPYLDLLRLPAEKEGLAPSINSAAELRQAQQAMRTIFDDFSTEKSGAYNATRRDTTQEPFPDYVIDRFELLNAAISAFLSPPLNEEDRPPETVLLGYSNQNPDITYADDLEDIEDTWQAYANCGGIDPDLFYPERGASTREAKEVCRACVVREDCLEYALAKPEKFGIWGGMSERERRRVRRQRNARAKIGPAV